RVRSAIFRLACVRRKLLAAGDAAVGRQAKPGGEVPGARPTVHVSADLTEDDEGGLETESQYLSQVRPGLLIQQCPRVEAQGLLGAPRLAVGGRQRWPWILALVIVKRGE